MRQSNFREDAAKRRHRMDAALKRTKVVYDDQRRTTLLYSTKAELEKLLLQHEMIQLLTRGKRRRVGGVARGEARVTHESEVAR